MPALTRLTALFLFGNYFDAEDSLAGVEELTALRWLSLDYCWLARLPNQLSMLTSLEHLYLKGNDLQRMTAAQLQGMLACMPHLTELTLDRNAASSAGLDALLALERTYPSLQLDLLDDRSPPHSLRRRSRRTTLAPPQLPLPPLAWDCSSCQPLIPTSHSQVSSRISGGLSRGIARAPGA